MAVETTSGRPMTAAARTMLADSTQIAASLVVEDIVKKKYRNVEPRPAHLKPPLAESPFGIFPASYHMRDTWGGNKTRRVTDRKSDVVVKASKDPLSYTNRNLPQRLEKKPEPKPFPKHLKMSMKETLSGGGKSGNLDPIEPQATTPKAKGVSNKNFAEPPEKLAMHLKSNFSVTGNSKIWKAPPRPLTAPQRRDLKKKTDIRNERVDELDRVEGYMKLTGKFLYKPSKLAENAPCARPMTAPPIRAARTAKLRAPKVPKAGAFRKRAIEATLFRKYYERGDLPVNIDHCAGGNKVLWKVDVRKLDYHVYLPIFVDGLREVDDPYRFLSIQGVIDMIQAAPEKLLPVVPQVILPINAALATREPDIICSVMKILQQMILQNPAVGQALVPYYRQVLPIFNLFRSKEQNLGDKFDFNQRRRLDLGELIRETLELMEMSGGPDAFVNIKYMCPTYESCSKM